ncbi:MAG: class I adenylate-forming enzyme family protein [Acidobacteriota bacterium]
MNAADLLPGNARRFPNRPALIYDDRTYSFSQLDGRANQAANALQSLGVQKRDVVALYTMNCPEWIEVFFAAGKIGAIIVPVNFRLRGGELHDILRHCEASVLIFDEELDSEVDQIRGGDLSQIHTIELGHRTASWALEYESWVSQAATTPPQEEVAGKDHHSICYTSGTTGRPKGAILTHNNVVIGTHYLSLANIGYTQEDTFLNPTPLCHRAGWARLIQSLGVGARQVLIRRFDPEKVLHLIERHRVTMAGFVPTMVRMMDQVSRKPDVSSLRKLLTTGEACPPPIKDRIFDLFPGVELITSFASTEAGIIALMSSKDPSYDPDGTGRPVMEVQVRILSDDGSARAAGEVGEILVRSGAPGEAGIMLGYLKDPAANEACFDGGWFRTGDCGFMSEQGLLYLCDRKKDMILSGGLNIYSKEVEHALLDHPAVEDAAVVGKPDPVWGEAVVAFVVRRPGAEVDDEALIAHCKQRLASYKKPQVVHLVEDLPKNTAGKILKYRLRERATAEKGVRH